VKRNRTRSRGEAAQLEMTPMIDVVFQLLIFFLVTIKPEDILSHLDINRPSPEKTDRPPEEEIQDLLTITVYRDGFMLKERRVSLRQIESRLTRLATYSRNISVIIKCTGDSPHAYLVQLLDVCAKAGLRNLSVFSM
jgi:biopolymer transport protein ExbD